VSKRNQSGRWFEEFQVGDVVEHAVTRTVTEADNVLFTCLPSSLNEWNLASL